MTSRKRAPRIALNWVSVLLLMICQPEREDALLVMLTWPAATRSATCAALRP